MNDVSKEIIYKEIDILLKEYDNICTGIRDYVKRMDKYITIYLGVSFAIIIACLRPEFNIKEFLKKINDSEFLVGIFLLVPILNSIFQIYILSIYYELVLMDRYISLVIATRLSEMIGRDVLGYGKALYLEEGWGVTITIAMVFWHLFILFVSIAILVFYYKILFLKSGALLFSIHLMGSLSIIMLFYCSIKYVRMESGFVKRLIG